MVEVAGRVEPHRVGPRRRVASGEQRRPRDEAALRDPVRTEVERLRDEAGRVGARPGGSAATRARRPRPTGARRRARRRRPPRAAASKPGKYGPIVGRLVTHEQYGIVFQKGSKLRAVVNPVLKGLIKDGTVGKLTKKWLTVNFADLPSFK